MDYQAIEIENSLSNNNNHVTTTYEFEESIIPYIYKLWRVIQLFKHL